MSLTAALTVQSTAATSSHCQSTADALDPTAAGHTALNDGSDGSYVYFTDHFATVDSAFITCELSDVPILQAILAITLRWRDREGGGGGGLAVGETNHTRAYVEVGGTKYYAPLATCVAGYTDREYSWTQNPATLEAWSASAANAARAGVELTSVGYPVFATSPEVVSLTGEVSYDPLPANVDTVRHLGSVDLFLKKSAESIGTFVGNLDLLAVPAVSPLLGLVELAHVAAPHVGPDGTEKGWGDETWQRRPMAIQGFSIDQNRYQVSAEILDQRRRRCLVRDLAWSDKASGALGDGIARFATPGATFHFSRASSATFTNPVGASETVGVDEPAYADGGLQILLASGGRAKDVYYVTNNAGARTWRAAQGSGVAEVRFAAVSGAASQMVASVPHDANNYAAVYWDGTNGRFRFEVAVAGSAASAYFVASPAPATWYQIGWRWGGSIGENGDAPYTLSIFVDRVRGVDGVAAGPMSEAGTCALEIGSYGTGSQLNGQFRNFHVFQHVLDDTEMARPL